MTTIVPRWEWRTFGSEFGAAEDVFAALEPTAIQESDEVYLRTESGPIVKIRDGLMDVKVLREVSPEGLEQWVPVMKEGFPLAAADVAKVFAMLEIDPPPLDRDSYTLDQFLSEVLAPHPQVSAVPIHKRRVRYTLQGCMAEMTDLLVDGVPMRTIAIESEDPDEVIAAVNAAGMQNLMNHNFVRAMTGILVDRAVRYAVIDVGTNSVKSHVAEQIPDGKWRAVVDRADVTRLGEGQQPNGAISDEAMERTGSAIAAMVDEARQNRARAIVIVGTAALRTASNRDEVIDHIRKRTGCTVEAISGEEEARLAYLAVRAELELDRGSLVVFDTGGGSSQFTFGDDDEVVERFSVPVGAVRYTETFGLHDAVEPDVLASALEAIANDLSAIDDRPPPDALVAMGGAVTNITAVYHRLETYDPDVVQGTILDRDEIDRQIELYRTQDTESRRSIVGLQPKRAEVILAGACVVRTVMEKLGQETLTVSDRGLRHGVLRERFRAQASGSEGRAGAPPSR
jgi:exopolyphosphatase / guanosine-5'-triphosphate,3'-diphosphate pyrophosphatase